MNERTEFLKKAVLTSVGAGTDVDRVKTAINDAMQDLVKVGTGLINELEEKGKVKADAVQDFLKNLQAEACKKSNEVEKQVSSTVTVGMKKAIRELGLITQEDWDELYERLAGIEEALGITNVDSNGSSEASEKPRRRKKHQS